MKTLASIAIICFALFTTSCEETKRVIDVAGSVQLSGTYVVNAMSNAETTPVNQTIIFAALDKSINGNAGCNSYFGKYTTDLYGITFSDIGSTKKMCAQNIMNAENALFAALDKAGSYALENDVLTLYSKTDRSVLITATKQK